MTKQREDVTTQRRRDQHDNVQLVLDRKASTRGMKYLGILPFKHSTIRMSAVSLQSNTMSPWHAGSSSLEVEERESGQGQLNLVKIITGKDM